MGIKVLHCSDIHLDAKHSDAFGKGNIRRQEQREIFSYIINLVKSENIDLFLIAGDLFELSRVKPDTIEFIKNQLNSLGNIPVFISPGNMDPFTEESPYSYSDWPANVTIFNMSRFKAEEIADKKIFVYGAANKSFEDDFLALKNFSPRKKEGIHIIIFHGTFSEYEYKKKLNCLPFKREDLVACGVDYIALGHMHNHQVIADFESAYYSGAPVHLDFNETDTKGVIVADIDKQDVRINFIPTDKRKFLAFDINCENFENQKHIIDEIKSLSEKNNLINDVVRIELIGKIPDILKINTEEIEESVKDSFFGIRLFNKTYPRFEFDALRNSNSLTGEYFRIMEEILSQDKSAKTEMALYYGLKALHPERFYKK